MQNVSDKFSPVKRPIKIAQFGEGNFLRAFVDWMIDNANERGMFDGNVAIIKPIERGSISAFEKQNCIYTVQLRGLVDGKPEVSTRVVRSVGNIIDPFANADAFFALACSNDLRFIVSNTTEAGIEFRADDPRPQGNAMALTYPGKLTQLLYARFEHFEGKAGSGLILLPVELIDRNGDMLKKCVMSYCDAWNLGDDFKRWLTDECVFASTLVDRIVTGYPRDDIAQIESELGYSDALITTGEPFALWVIESERDISDELPLDKCGLPVIFTRNLKPYKERKVRLLNGAHTSGVAAAYLCGCRTVLEMMNDPQMGKFIEEAMFNEMSPCVPLPREEADDFARSVIERFRNPYVKHQLISISLNSFSKWRARLLNTLKDNVARGVLPRRVTFSMAALLEFYTGKCEADGYYGTANGEKYRIQDDDRVIEAVSKVCDLKPEEYVHAILTRTDFWGEDLTLIPDFESTVIKDLTAIRTQGIREALKSLN